MGRSQQLPLPLLNRPSTFSTRRVDHTGGVETRTVIHDRQGRPLRFEAQGCLDLCSPGVKMASRPMYSNSCRIVRCKGR